MRGELVEWYPKLLRARLLTPALAWLAAACASTPPSSAPKPSPSASSAALANASSTAAPEPPSSAAPPPAGQRCEPPDAEIEVLAKAPGATIFTTDGRDLYWSDGHQVWRAPATGGEATRILREVVSVAPVKMMIASADELWLGSMQWLAGGCLGRVSVSDRDGKKLRKITPDACVEGLALAEANVVFSLNGTSNDGAIVGTVRVAKRTGSSSKAITERFNGGSSVATDGEWIYYAAEIGTLDRIDFSGHRREKLVDGHQVDDIINDAEARRFAVDETALYFLHGHLNLNGYRLRRVSKVGGPTTKLADALDKLGDPTDYPNGRLTLDAGHVYWSYPGKGEIRFTDKAGACGLRVLVSGRNSPDFVTPVGGYLYWLDVKASPPVVVRRKLAW